MNIFVMQKLESIPLSNVLKNTLNLGQLLALTQGYLKIIRNA